MIDTVTSLSADADAFHIAGTLVVSEDGAEVHRRAWDERVVRDGVWRVECGVELW